MKFEYAIPHIREEKEVFIYREELDKWVNLGELKLIGKKFTIKELLNSNFCVKLIRINEDGLISEKTLYDDEPGVIHP